MTGLTWQITWDKDCFDELCTVVNIEAWAPRLYSLKHSLFYIFLFSSLPLNPIFHTFNTHVSCKVCILVKVSLNFKLIDFKDFLLGVMVYFVLGGGEEERRGEEVEDRR